MGGAGLALVRFFNLGGTCGLAGIPQIRARDTDGIWHDLPVDGAPRLTGQPTMMTRRSWMTKNTRWARCGLGAVLAVLAWAPACSDSRTLPPPSNDLCESIRKSRTGALTAEAFRAAAPYLDPKTQAAALALAEYIEEMKREGKSGNVFSIAGPDGNPAKAMFTISAYDLNVCEAPSGPSGTR